MATFKDRGVVLSESPQGETGKRVVLLLEGRGKAVATARGARKSNSGLRAACGLFAFSEFVLYEGGGFLSVTQGDVLEPFGEIGADYERLRAACACAELADKTMLPGMPAKKALRLLVTALRGLERGVPPKLALAAFQFRYLKLEGFTPTLAYCAACGGETGADRFGEEGLVCGKCADGHSVAFDADAADALAYILEERTTAIEITQETAARLAAAAALFLEMHVGIRMKSLG